LSPSALSPRPSGRSALRVWMVQIAITGFLRGLFSPMPCCSRLVTTGAQSFMGGRYAFWVNAEEQALPCSGRSNPAELALRRPMARQWAFAEVNSDVVAAIRYETDLWPADGHPGLGGGVMLVEGLCVAGTGQARLGINASSSFALMRFVARAS